MARIPRTHEPSLELFGESVRRNVAKIAEGFTEPDDDWLPGLLHLENERHLHEVYAPEPGLFAPERKDALFRYLAELLLERRAIRYALLINGWMLRAAMREGESKEEASERFMAQSGEWLDHFSEHPERIEVLTIEVVDRQRAESWQALIERHPDRPPTLGAWERLGPEISGRVSWLREALAA